GLAVITEPVITDLGKRPSPNTPEVIPFAQAMRAQSLQMVLWWLDRMALSNHGLSERMVWFWHGHWATSIDKINYPLPMFTQNKTLRTNALGNFKEMSRAMINDGALQIWLDGGDSTLKAPNENLSRELMELFVLGVNRYSEDDVKALAKVLTGYQINNSSGKVTFNLKRHDPSAVTLLGSSAIFSGESVSDYLVARDDCATFIAERLWYRFVSSSQPLPTDSTIKKAFAERNIASAVTALASDVAMRDPNNSLVKAPVEWFISACRALQITPSKLDSSNQLISHLQKLVQVPFSPPNVGGWPADEAWLSSASAQYRIAFAKWLIKQGDLTPITSISQNARVAKSADWLGVSAWSNRTQGALRNAVGDPAEFVLLALCSPEYVVSA
ncbi:MAG: DUF1800 family protein, partial [Actinobacteria bacterium]|nr:DUF1800 family protein [Actinomycetota bacterium]